MQLNEVSPSVFEEHRRVSFVFFSADEFHFHLPSIHDALFGRTDYMGPVSPAWSRQHFRAHCRMLLTVLLDRDLDIFSDEV